VLGVGAGFLDISKLEVRIGEYWTPESAMTKEKVVVL
jgi:hypothetical protein